MTLPRRRPNTSTRIVTAVKADMLNRFVIAVPLKLSANYLASVHYTMTALVGIFSCALGAFTVVEIGYLKAVLLG